jgi:hypothetical protein
MLGEFYIFACEPGIPYESQEPWRAEISQVHPSGRAAVASLMPPVEVASGDLAGEPVSKFVLTTRHVGGTINMAEDGFVVVYLHPYRDDETPSFEGMSELGKSAGLSRAIGYCTLANRETATKDLKLRLEDK